MFTILGGDGKEYGPASAEQIRAWITAGRANLDTKAKLAGSDEWRRLGDYPEFNGSAVPPPVGSAAATFPAPTSTGVTLAGGKAAARGKRLGARVIDWIVAMIFAAPALMILGSEFVRLFVLLAQGHQPDFQSIDTSVWIRGGAILFLGWLIGLAIQVTLLSTRSQSIGKLLLKIKVVRIDGTKAGIVHAWLLREALISVIGAFAGIIPFLGMLLRPAFHLTDWLMIFRGDERCLHDLIAGTRVVDA